MCVLANKLLAISLGYVDILGGPGIENKKRVVLVMNIQVVNVA